ncbi:MAG: DUF106 domain-containing protein [DPANN group archaeon]|nr:DUF106 domain-containing protein [DPANN group archaeon]
MVTPIIQLTIITIIIASIFTIAQKKLVDQTKMKHLKSETLKIRGKLKKAQEEKNQKEIDALVQKSLSMSQKQMSMSMKPMAVSMVVVLLAFPWIAKTFSSLIVTLPFSIPLLASSGTVGWLGFYIMISIPTTIVLRKVLGVE